MMVGWLAVYLPRSVISEFMRIDWETVGRCVSRVLNVIEPERTKRLDGLVRIGIDETSYRKGHKYITVIVNHDTNTVVWAAQGHGKAVLQTFYRQLSPEAVIEHQGSYRRRSQMDHRMSQGVYPRLRTLR
ncbi:MAG: transposase [Thermoguttaceae bacterium]|nr:transposase [Thermoguttaceae bacterium]